MGLSPPRNKGEERMSRRERAGKPQGPRGDSTTTKKKGGVRGPGGRRGG